MSEDHEHDGLDDTAGRAIVAAVERGDTITLVLGVWDAMAVIGGCQTSLQWDELPPGARVCCERIINLIFEEMPYLRPASEGT